MTTGFTTFTNTQDSKPYICIHIRSKSGRDVNNNKQGGDFILKRLNASNLPASVITVEKIDIQRELIESLR